MASKVSVCMPTYNCAAYVGEAIESVLDQVYPDYELVIIDNCSTDTTGQIIGRYAARDRRIRSLVNPRNIGMVNNWNRCIQEAQGEYVKFLFGDDRLASRHALQHLAAVMDGDRSTAIVASARYVIDEGSHIVKRLSRYGTRDICMPGTEVIKDCLIEQRNFIGEPSVVMFRREQGKRGFDGRYRQLVDLEMWLHLLEQGSFAYLAEPLSSFRVHDGQATASNMDENVHIDDQMRLTKEYEGRSYLHFGPLERAYMRSVPAVSSWRLFRRHGKLSWEAAVDRIRQIYGGRLVTFFAFLPVHRMIKLFQTIRRRRMIMTRKGLVP